MKQTINVGGAVDDGTGDYLRASSIKTRDNFDDIYDNLGDGVSIHSAGAWKTWRFASVYLNGDTVWDESKRNEYFDDIGNGSGPWLYPRFGDSWIIDTSLSAVNVQLPPGIEKVDYGNVIRLRDVLGTWGNYGCLVYPDAKDSVKLLTSTDPSVTGAKKAEFNTNYQDLEMVFSPPRHWEYVAQKFTTGLTFGDVPSVLRKAVLALDDQRDFNTETMFNGIYNNVAVEVYRRGNLMFYGDELSEFSDYGSIPTHTLDEWKPNNPVEYKFGDLVYGDVTGGRDDRIWQANETHNSGTSFDDRQWILWGQRPDWEDYKKNTEYEAGDNVLQEYDGFIERFECLLSHTSPNNNNTVLVNDIKWKRITNGDLAPLDGRTIRLSLGAKVNDPIAVVTYLSDVSNFRTSVEMRSVKVISDENYSESALTGQIVKKALVDGMTLTLSEFGYSELSTFNINAMELLVNGVRYVNPGQAGTGFTGGESDYTYSKDSAGNYNIINFTEKLSDGDVVTVRWYDNILGSLLTFDEGDNNILSYSRDYFISRDDWLEKRRINTLSYADPSKPSGGNAVINVEEELFEPATNITSLMDTVHPIGTVYTNANNPNNPSEYMGFGTWVRYAEGKNIVGWDSDPNSALFHLNNNNSDVPQAGGTGGELSITLQTKHIPELISSVSDSPDSSNDRDISQQGEQYSLVARNQGVGGINLNGCLGEPGTTPLAFYREEPIRVNYGQIAEGFFIVQPFITAYTWIRTA